jgi:MFS family permease
MALLEGSGAPLGRLLSHAGFLRFLSARLLASIAVQMQTVAVGWQVYAITGKPLDLGLIGLSQFLPFVLLVLPAGHVADRYNRAMILSLCIALEFFCALALLAFTLSGLEVAWPVFAVMVVFGIARAFSMPAGQAIMPNLVPPSLFSRAVAVNSSAWQVSTIAGPAIGGLVYLLGPDIVYGTVAALLAAAFVLIIGVKTAKPARPDQPDSWHVLLEGLRFVWKKKVILGAVSLDLFAVLFGGAVALLPAYASDILHVGRTASGWLRAAPGIGAAIVAISLAGQPDHAPRRRQDVRGRRGVRAGDDRLRPLARVLRIARGARRHRRLRHGERLHPPHARAARDAGRDPRPRERGERRLHRRLERARRVRVWRHGRLVGAQARRRRRRHRKRRDRRSLDARFSGAAAHGRVPGARNPVHLTKKGCSCISIQYASPGRERTGCGLQPHRPLRVAICRSSR